jgi:hypothetical protein
LHADQADEATAGCLDLTGDALDVDDGVALVTGVDRRCRRRAEHLASRAFGEQP